MNALVQYQVTDMERMAQAIAGSKLFGIQNPEQALALCLVAQAEGRHPATAAQDYHILQGRPSKKADAMLRDFLAGGGRVEWHALSDTIADATFSHPAGGSARIDWTMARAKQAGLTTAMWSKYPRQMLRARTVSEGVRTVFPMATSGMYVPEEVAEFTPATNGAAPAASFDNGEVIDQAPASRIDDRGVKRLSSAKAKDIGLDKDIRDAIDGCTTRSELAEWDQDFAKHTAQCPLSWLDAIRNQVILRGEAINAEQGHAELDAGFAAAVGRDSDFPGDRPRANGPARDIDAPPF